MEEMTKPKLINTQMIQINACRIRLQVSFLSDMILPNEKYILKQFPIEEKPKHLTPNHGWPKQDNPSPQAKKLQNNKIKKIYFNSNHYPFQQ